MPCPAQGGHHTQKYSCIKIFSPPTRWSSHFLLRLKQLTKIIFISFTSSINTLFLPVHHSDQIYKFHQFNLGHIYHFPPISSFLISLIILLISIHLTSFILPINSKKFNVKKTILELFFLTFWTNYIIHSNFIYYRFKLLSKLQKIVD